MSNQSRFGSVSRSASRSAAKMAVLSVASGLCATLVVFAAHAKTKDAAAGKDIVIEGEKPSIGNPNAPQGGTLNVVWTTEPSSLNPISEADLYSARLDSLVMETMMERNLETYDWQPLLADKAIEAADGKSITFHVRSGATFQDGKPVTAEDVKFSFDCIFDPKYKAMQKQAYFENIEKAEIVDPQTVKFSLKEKYFGNFETLALMTIVPKHFYGDPDVSAKKNKTILGSGPYKLETYDQGQSILLVRNKNWWGNTSSQEKGRYNFEHVRVRFVKDENIILETLKKGDVDIYDDITPDAYAQKAVGPEWGKTVFKVKTANLLPKSYNYVGWNLRREMFQDKNVRLALAMLMNRDEMIKKFRFDMSTPASGPWDKQSEYADSKIKPVPFDPKKAVEILKTAGWSDIDHDGMLKKMVNGKKVDLHFTLYYPNKDREKYYVLYQSDLKKVGVVMDLQLLEWNALLKSMDENNFDAVTLGWGGGTVDLDPKQIWSSSSAVKGGSNFIGYKNPEVDKLIDEARVELDKKKRIPLLRNVYDKIAADYPYAFMFNEKYVLYAHSNKVAMTKETMKYDVGADYWWAAKP